MMNDDETKLCAATVALLQAANDTIKQQADEIEQLRADLRDTRKAYRELIILHEDDGK